MTELTRSPDHQRRRARRAHAYPSERLSFHLRHFTDFSLSTLICSTVWYPALLSHFLARVRGVVPHLRLLPSKHADPSTIVSRKTYRAFIDDCDYNAHLSNSAYAKNLDASRML